MRRLRVLVLVHPDLVPPPAVDESQILEAPWKMEYDVVVTLEHLGHTIEVLGVGDELRPIRERVTDMAPDIVFNLLEGFDDVRELDAHVVAYLELLGVAYTGCNPRGLLLSRDKALSKKLLSYHRIPHPRFAVYRRNRRPRRPRHLRLPLIVKTLDQDSSVGIAQASVVSSDEELAQRVAFVHESLGTAAIAEEYVDGRELYVGVLGNHRLRSFPTWELSMDRLPPSGRLIATEHVKFRDDYQKRYGIRWGPAEGLGEELERRLQRLARRAFRALELNGYARVDFRLDADGEPRVLEANANPDIGYGAEFPESAHLAGLPYDRLLQRLLSLGLAWRDEWRR